MEELMRRLRPEWTKSVKLVLGGLTLVGTLAVFSGTSQAQDYAEQPYYYQYQYQPPPPPPPQIVVVPPVTYQRPYDPRAMYWARRHWLRHHRHHHHDGGHERGHERGSERHGRGHRH
jgi:hypothetical protein